MKTKEIKEFLVYGIIGVVNTGIHFFVFSLCTTVYSQTLSNSLAFTVAVIFSFICNSIFTFKEKPTGIKFAKMYFSMLIVSAGFGFVGDYFSLHPWITIFLYFIVNPIIGFLITKYFVFGK